MPATAFYQPQLEAELGHPVLSALLDTDWQKLISGLLSDELAELIKMRQGFLLRVGRNSGAESVTLNGMRDIKILGKQGQQPTYRSATTQKRFASLNKAGVRQPPTSGWLWVNACDDQHRHLFDSVRQTRDTQQRATRGASSAPSTS